MANFTIKAILQGVDRITAPFKSGGRSADHLRDSLATAQRSLADLDRAAADLKNFRQVKTQALESAKGMRVARQAAADLEAPFQAAAQRSAELETELKKARRSADSLRKMGASADELRKAEAAVTATEKALKAQNKETKKAERDWTKASRSAEALAKQAASQREAMDGLSDRLRQAGLNTNQLAASERKLRADAARARAETERQTKALEQQKRKTEALARARERAARIRDTSAQIAGVGARSAGIGAGMAVGGGLFAQAGISFEASMSEVGAIARLSKGSDALNGLRAQAEKLGSETSFSATQVAGGQKFLAMAGYTPEAIRDSIGDVLNLATAGGVELDVAADISSNIGSAFKIPAEQTSRVTDVLTATFTRSNVSLQTLGETMKYAAPIANQLGISLEQTSAMAGLLGNVGIQGSEAGTALKAIYNRLASPPKMARDALAELGVETRDLATGNLRDMPSILADIAEATEGMGTADKIGYLKAIGGQEASGALSELITQSDMSADKIREFAEVMRNSAGETTRVATQMADNTRGDLRSMASAWEGLSITLFDSNSGPLRDIIQSVTAVLRGITEWAKANPELTSTIVKVAAAITALLIGFGGIAMTVAGILMPFAMLQGTLLKLGVGAAEGGKGFSLFRSIFRGFGSVIKGGLGLLPRLFGGLKMVGLGIRAIGLAMAANPVGAVITGIALAASLIYIYWEPIKAFFLGVWEKIRGPLNTLWGWVKTVFSWSPIGMIVTNWDGITSYFGGLFDRVGDIASAAWDGLRSLFFTYHPLGIIIENWGALPDYFGGLWDTITATTQDAVAWIFDILNDMAAPFDWLAEKLGMASSGPAPVMASGSLRARPSSIPIARTADLVNTNAGMAPRQVTQTNNQTNTITINAAPGMDPKDVAREVQGAMTANQRAAARHGPRGAQLYDGID